MPKYQGSNAEASEKVMYEYQGLNESMNEY